MAPGNSLSAEPGPFLEPAIQRFESFQSVEKLKARLTKRAGARRELLSVLYSESNAIHSHTCLVRHFELDR
jgi:hypothetical protein